MPSSKQGVYRDHQSVTPYLVDEGTLRGLRHRTVLDGRDEAQALTLWVEEHLSGFAVPLHRHDCEEIIVVAQGEIEITVGSGQKRLSADHSALIPAWSLHGFRVVSENPVKLFCVFSSPDPGIFREDGTRSAPPWEGGESGHLDD